MVRRRSLLFVFAVFVASPPVWGQAAPDNTAGLPPMANSARGSFRSVLRPAVEINLPARAAGVLDAIHVEEGQPVSVGQLIMSLDSDQERAEVAQAEAAVRGTKAEMDRAVAEFERIQQVGDEKIYSEKQVLEAKTDAELARSRHDQSNAALAIARVRLANRQIVSPIRGHFLKKYKEVGEAVERYETVVRVVDVTSLEMMVYCDARYFSLFKTGQHVDVKVFKSSEDQPVVSGLIVHTDPIIDSSSGTFRVKVKISPSDQSIAGLSALLIAPQAGPIRAPL
jgi:RND family efflux transporter MFP subunit